MGEGVQLVVGVLQVGLHLFALGELASRGLVKLRAIDQHRQLAADRSKQCDLIRGKFSDVPPAKYERTDCATLDDEWNTSNDPKAFRLQQTL